MLIDGDEAITLSQKLGNIINIVPFTFTAFVNQQRANRPYPRRTE